MAVEKIPSKVIYIGGIPFDQTEEQILEIAKTVGPVQRIQLIIDKETGKSRGYAFVEYFDEQTAASAVRNLSSYNIGNRVLKCSFSNENLMLDPFGNQNPSQQHKLNTNNAHNNHNNNGNGHHNRKKQQSIPPLPPGVDVINEKPGDAISRELSKIDQTRLSKIVHDSIKMANSNPKLMEELLQKNPQLSYAIVQASLMVKAISENELAGLVKEIPDDVLEPEVVEQPLTEEQTNLIKQVMALTDLELNGMPEEQKKVVYQIKGQYLGVL